MQLIGARAWFTPRFLAWGSIKEPLASPTSSTRRTSAAVVSFGRAFSPASLFEPLIDSLREVFGVLQSLIDLAASYHVRVFHHRGQITAISEDF